VRGALGAPLPHVPPRELRTLLPPPGEVQRHAARDLFDEVEPQLKQAILGHTRNLTQTLKSHLDTMGKSAREEEEQRYRSRQAEVSTLIASNTLVKLEREIDELKRQRQQGYLFDGEQRLEEIDRSIDERRTEIERRTRHYNEVRDQLERERDRILKFLLPRRYAMTGHAQVFPVSIEIRLPAGAS
jgi:hypothetical protein